MLEVCGYHFFKSVSKNLISVYIEVSVYLTLDSEGYNSSA